MRILKIVLSVGLIAATMFLLGAVYYAKAQIVPAQNQLIPSSYFGDGYLISTSTIGTHKLGALPVDLAGAFITGILGVSNGGTGSSTLTGILRGDGTNAIKTLLIGTGLSYNGTTLSSTVTGNVATSSAETRGNLAYWTSTNGTPALLGSVATTSLSFGSDLTVTGTLGALVGGTNASVACRAASASQSGCLSATDFTLFNNKTNSKWATSTDTTSIYLAGATKVGIGTSSPTILLDLSSTDSGTTVTNASASTLNITNTDTTNNNFGALTFSGVDTNGNTAVTSKIIGITSDHTAGGQSGDIAFAVRNTSAGFLEKMRLSTLGNFGINTTIPSTFLSVNASSTATTSPTIRIGSVSAGLVSGSNIGSIVFASRDSQITDPNGIPACTIETQANRTHTATVADSDLVFFCVGGIGTVQSEKMRLAANGVGFGASPSVATLKLFTLLGVSDGVAFGDSTYNTTPPAGGMLVQGRVAIATTTTASFDAINTQLFVVNGQTAAGQNNNYTANFLRVGNGTTGTVIQGSTERTANSAFNLLRLQTDVDNASTTQFLVRGDGRVSIGTSSPSSLLNVSGSDAGTTITSASVAMIDITNTNTTNNNFSDLAFSTNDTSAAAPVVTSKIVGVHSSHTGAATTGYIAFLTRNAGTIAEKMRITTDGAMQMVGVAAASLTKVVGQIWYDTTQLSWSVYDTGGIVRTVNGTIFTSTADKVVTNTTVETDAPGTGIGTYTLPANWCAPGKTIRIGMTGLYALPLTGGTATLKIQYVTNTSTTTIASVATTGLLSNAANQWYKGSSVTAIRTCGASGTAVSGGEVRYQSTVAGGSITDNMSAPAAVTIDTTKAGKIVPTITWDTADAAKIATTTTVTIEILN